ncbi:unnamed protein product [Lampetra planeri]
MVPVTGTAAGEVAAPKAGGAAAASSPRQVEDGWRRMEEQLESLRTVLLQLVSLVTSSASSGACRRYCRGVTCRGFRLESWRFPLRKRRPQSQALGRHPPLRALRRPCGRTPPSWAARLRCGQSPPFPVSRVARWLWGPLLLLGDRGLSAPDGFCT